MGTRGLTSAFALVLLLTTPRLAHAATINVETANPLPGDNLCSLLEALSNAVDQFDGQPFADCEAGATNPATEDVVVLQTDASYVVTQSFLPVWGPTGLPPIGSNVRIEGNGSTIQRSGQAPRFRLFTVIENGVLRLRDLVLRGGHAQGGDGGIGDNSDPNNVAPAFAGGGGAGMGGLVFVQNGTLDAQSCTFQAGRAEGGRGGQSDSAESGAGGGGVGGNGGAGRDLSGAGGGGWGGHGARALAGGGGGGGGTDAPPTGNGQESPDSSTGGAGGSSNGGEGGDAASDELEKLATPGENGGPGGGGGGGGGASGEFNGAGGGAGGDGGGGGGAGKGADGGNGGFGGGGGGTGRLFSGGGDGGFGGGAGAIGSPGYAGGESFGTSSGGGAGLGGAIFLHGGTLTLINSTFTENRAVGGRCVRRIGQTPDADCPNIQPTAHGRGWGGAVFVRNGSTTIRHVTFSGNVAEAGGALWIVADGANANLELENSILADSVDGAAAAVNDCTATTTNAGNVSLSQAGGNVIELNNACGAPSATTDPALQPLGDNGGSTPTMAIPGTSVASQLTSTDCLSVDQRDVPRSATCDSGAYEHRGGELSIVSTGSHPETDADISRVVVTVARQNGAEGAASVKVALAGGTAIAGTDFVDPGETLLSWADGESGSKSASFTIEGEDLVEADETIDLQILDSSPGTSIVAPSTGTYTILNDDSAVAGLGGDVSGPEDGGPLTFTATLSAPVDVDATITVSTSDGTAQAPGDYGALSNHPVIVPAGQTFATFDVTIHDDGFLEADETFTVAVTGASAPGRNVSGPGPAGALSLVAAGPVGGSAQGTILNDDPGADFSATKSVASLTQETVTYQIVITNNGGASLDNAGDELVDVLPASLVVVSATADVGTATVDGPGNAVRWNGALAAAPGPGNVAILSIEADIVPGTQGLVANQATLSWDSDNDANNDAAGVSDDPSLPAADDPTSFVVPVPAGIPTLGGLGSLLLGLALAGAGLLVLRRSLG